MEADAGQGRTRAVFTHGRKSLGMNGMLGCGICLYSLCSPGKGFFPLRTRGDLRAFPAQPSVPLGRTSLGKDLFHWRNV